MGDCTLALYPRPGPAESTALWGHVYERPQTSNFGVRVPDLADASDRLSAATVQILRADQDAIVIPPGATGGVTVVVVDRLLPGDPRA